MSAFDREALLRAGADGLVGDPHDFLVAADRCLSLGDEAAALIALDRAYGLAPDDATIATMRSSLLERFAIEEHGLVFRYVPAGTFVMGSTTGDPDERPVHPVTLDEYWIAEVPITWSAFCRLAGWSEPPSSMPPEPGKEALYLHQANKIRRQYCETETTQAGDWHAHTDDQDEESQRFFGTVPRRHPERPLSYDRKPMVAVGLLDAETLAARITDERVEYALPSEAEWEKAARGGLIGKRYPWGDEPPTRSRCDFDHFGDFKLADPRSFAPNGYGLYGMAGGVWEWTSTTYDALAYSGGSSRDEAGDNDPYLRVLRGGSWADAAAAVTVSFRSARLGAGWEEGWGDSFNPNVGFRLVRRLRGR